MYFNTHKTVILLLFAAILPFSLRAQSQISGMVRDAETKEPLDGVTIRLAGSTLQTVTNAKGEFHLNVAIPEAEIILSSIGYKTEKHKVTRTNTPLVFDLLKEDQYLDEVVIMGYTTQLKKAVTGAITSVDFSEATTNQADQDPIKLLQGKTPGVQITGTSGSPGGGVSFVIRGNNSIGGTVAPLYVVDGIFLNTTLPVTGGGGNLLSNPLADINPADIENITILKDANATAIYGSQGANGVVVITTKRGRRNSGIRVNFSLRQGQSEAVNRFKVTTGPETGRLLQESWANTAYDNGESLEEYILRERPTSWDLVYPYIGPGGEPNFSQTNIADLPTYDRISDLFQTANTADYQLSIAGGSATSNHYIGLGYANQESIVRPNAFERISGRINYDNHVSEKLKVGTSFNITRTERSKVRNNDNDPGGIINSAIFPRSFLPVYDDNGQYLNHATFNNHLRLIEHLDNAYQTWRNTVNLYGEYAIIPELKFRSSWSFDFTNNQARSFSDFALSNTGAASVSNQMYQIYTAEQILTYNNRFSDTHQVDILLGNTFHINQAQGVSASGSNYIFDELREVSSAANTNGGSFRNESRLVSFFGKAGYGWNDRLGMEFSLRADGSSRFGNNVRWGYFPAVGAVWHIGSEPIIRQLEVFDALKVRGSFGYAGNQHGIGDYDALAIWLSNAQAYLDQPSLSPGRLANPNLTWETSRQANVGIDASFARNRIHWTIDLYHKYTTNGLQSVTIPSRSGYSSAIQNYSEISNRGIEFSLYTLNFARDNWQWSTDFNISANRNRIEKIPQEQTLGATNRGTSILREGYPVNSFFLYKQLYVDPQTGNAVYDDVDQNGIIDYADRQIVGSAEPNFLGGLTNTVSYKNFEVNVFFYFTQGNDLLNMQSFFMVHGGTQNGIGFDARQLDRWQKPGDITDIPRLTRHSRNPDLNNSAANNYTGQVANLSSRYLADGSFLRLRNLAVNYNFPQLWTQGLGIDRIKATISATNLWTWTSYDGLDPEVSAQSTNQNTAGYDWATIPQPRTFEAILTLTF